MRHTHYTVLGYDEEIPGLGGVKLLEGQVILDLIATNEAEAISKAQKLAWGGIGIVYHLSLNMTPI